MILADWKDIAAIIGIVVAVLTYPTNSYFDTKNLEAEKKFNRFLGDIEKIAYLTSHGGVPATVQVYMFGWCAQKVHPHLTNGERNNIFWDLAIHYIDELKKAADDYSKFPNEKRKKYLKKILSFTKNTPNMVLVWDASPRCGSRAVACRRFSL